MKKENLVACDFCGVHEPTETLTDGICIECINDRIKVPPPRPIEYTKVKKERKPVDSNIFIWGAFLSLFIGFYVVLKYEQMWGAFLILTVAPCLFLYPIVRFLFGGKDSIGVAVVTVIAEEFLKSKITDALTKNDKNRKY